MKTQRLSALIVLLSLGARCVAQTTTAAVSGLVRDKHTRSSVSNVTVILGADKNKGGQLIPDVTTSEGVYNLSTDSVHASVDALYVWSKEPYHSRPQEASLDPEIKGVRRSKPPSLDVVTNTASPLAKKEVVYVIVCIEETEGLKKKLSFQSAAETEEKVKGETLQAIARFPAAKIDNVLSDIIDASQRLLNRKLVPETILSRNQILDLRNSEEFRAGYARTQTLLEHVQRYLSETATYSRDILDFAVTVDPTLIHPAWFDNQTVAARIQNDLHHLERERADYWFDVVACDSESRTKPPKGLKIKEGRLSTEALVQWVADNREGGRYFLLRAVLATRDLPKADQEKVAERLRHIRPVVVPLDREVQSFPRRREGD